jgi:hypothetical protein
MEKEKKLNCVWTPEKLDELGDALVAHCELPDVWHMSSFTAMHKKPLSWLHDLARQHECFKKYLPLAKQALGRKILKHSFQGGKGNSFLVERLSSMYLNDVDQYEVKRDKRRLEM